MSARFLAVVTGGVLAFALASGAWFAAVGPGGEALVAFVGLQVLGLTTFLRAVLLATVPQGDAAQAVVSHRRRHRWTAGGVLVGALTTVVGLLLVLDPLVAGLACVGLIGGLLVLVRALDGHSKRTAQSHPVDAVRPGDADRLAPEAIRATLLRRSTQGLVAGAVAAAVVAPLVGYYGSGAVAGPLAGFATLVAVTALVLGVGSYSLTLAAGRRVNALMSQDPARMKRLRKAVLRRRTTELDEDDLREARRWARLAEPALLLQVLIQLPVLVMVPGLQGLQLVFEPDDVLRRWLVGGFVVLCVPAYAVLLLQWRRTRAFAGGQVA